MLDLLQRLEMQHPIILAPMAGGPGTPELAAAVSNAGGLGSFGAAYLATEDITAAIARIRGLTDRLFAVNLFAGGRDTGRAVDATRMLRLIGEVHMRLGLPAPVLPAFPPDTFEDELEAVLAARPAAFSFTFGVPRPEVMARLRALGIVTLGTATTLEEARVLEGAGVDAIVAQGAEAGAHRGTFAGPFADAMVPTAALVSAVRAATALPVVGSGGVMDGSDIAALLALGASAVQMGTAFLACPESRVPDPYRRALLSVGDDATVITRAFSGRPARGIANTFTRLLAAHEADLLPFPQQNALTRPLRAAAAQQDDPEFLALWAGTGVSRIRALPAAELVERLAEELQAARPGRTEP